MQKCQQYQSKKVKNGINTVVLCIILLKGGDIFGQINLFWNLAGHAKGKGRTYDSYKKLWIRRNGGVDWYMYPPDCCCQEKMRLFNQTGKKSRDVLWGYAGKQYICSFVILKFLNTICSCF